MPGTGRRSDLAGTFADRVDQRPPRADSVDAGEPPRGGACARSEATVVAGTWTGRLGAASTAAQAVAAQASGPDSSASGPAREVRGAPVDPTPRTLTQPDGTTFTGRWGTADRPGHAVPGLHRAAEDTRHPGAVRGPGLDRDDACRLDWRFFGATDSVREKVGPHAVVGARHPNCCVPAPHPSRVRRGAASARALPRRAAADRLRPGWRAGRRAPPAAPRRRGRRRSSPGPAPTPCAA